MLLWKKPEPEQTVIAPKNEAIASESHDLLLPERTSNELIAELEDMTAARSGTRKAILASYFAGLGLYAVTFFVFLSGHINSAKSLGLFTFLFILLGSLGFMAVGMYGALRIGRSFYKRRRERLQAVIPALAERGDPRLLPHLLGLVDMKYSGVLMWRESRPVLLGALETLMAKITPEQFQELSRQQMWDIIVMAYYPDGRLREEIADAVIRCGDSRTLEALKKLRVLVATGVSIGKTPLTTWNPMVWYLRKEGVPFPTAETTVAIDRAVAGLTSQVDEMRRTAQLLRPSGKDSALDGQELVRAALSSGDATAVEQLVRPSDAAETALKS